MNSSRQFTRIMGPSLGENGHIDDSMYTIYGLHYGDYLLRVVRRGGEKPYIAPPTFPRGRMVTFKSYQLHRRMYAMYMNAATKQAPAADIPGYCYLLGVPEGQRREQGLNHGPYPLVDDLHDLPFVEGSELYVTIQDDGTLHVHKQQTKDSVKLVSLQQLTEASGHRVGGITPADFQAHYRSLSMMILRSSSQQWAYGLPSEAIHKMKYKLDYMFHTDGTWTRTFSLLAGSLLCVPKGYLAEHGDMAIGSKDRDCYVYALGAVQVTLRSGRVVAKRDIDKELGPGVSWSSSLTTKFGDTAPEWKARVYQVGIHDLGMRIALREYAEQFPVVFHAGFAVSPTVSSAVEDVRLTDPFDHRAAVVEHRLTCHTGGDPVVFCDRSWFTCGQFRTHWDADGVTCMIGDCFRMGSDEPDKSVLVLSGSYVRFVDGISKSEDAQASVHVGYLNDAEAFDMEHDYTLSDCGSFDDSDWS